MEKSAFGFALKSATDSNDVGTFVGLASTYNNIDLAGEVVDRGAFTKTLQERGRVPILFQHQQANPVGLGTLVDGFDGLTIKGTLDLDIPEGRRAYSGLKKGYLTGLSIGYDVIQKHFKDGALHLREIRLHEVSLVTFPCNTEAQVTSVKRLLAGKAGARLSAASRSLIADGVQHIEAAHAANATARRSHTKALDVFEKLLNGSGESSLEAQDGDVKAIADMLNAQNKQLRDALVSAPSRSSATIARELNRGWDRVNAMLRGR